MRAVPPELHAQTRPSLHCAGQSCLPQHFTTHNHVAAVSTASCGETSSSFDYATRPTTLASGRRSDESDGSDAFQDLYAAKHRAQLRGNLSNILTSPPGLGNSVHIGGQAGARNSSCTNPSKSSWTSERNASGPLAKLAEHLIVIRQVAGSTLASDHVTRRGGLQLCILIDTPGLEDHIMPRNFIPLDLFTSFTLNT